MGKFIILTICAYFIFRWLDRMFRPAKRKERFQSNTDKNKRSKQSFDNPKSKTVMKDDVGEYIDFEEVKEEK